jgi:hypothetical protein
MSVFNVGVRCRYRVYNSSYTYIYIASAFTRGIHPLKIFKIVDVQGGECL